MTIPMAKNADHLFMKQKFDANWYAESYADVALTGLEPEYHYRTYGYPLLSRPPNASIASDRAMLEAFMLAPPPEDSELLFAYKLLQDGSPEAALGYARLYLPEALTYTAEIIRANVALSAGNEQSWLDGLNAYLDHFGVENVILLPDEVSPIARLAVPDLRYIEGGPLVSIIMPAWNAEEWLEMAVGSILNQTWRNLELIVVDDASSDGTWTILSRLAARDSRLRIRRNRTNVGPYVSKNLGLDMASGEWVTGHDADDWAHPRRIERHLKDVLSQPTPPRASFTYMIRMQVSGHFDTISSVSPFSPDGVTRVSSISTLFSRDILRKNLGYWDSVRFGADSEMIARAKKLLGHEFLELKHIGMICLSTETGLTNHPDFGIRANAGRPVPDRIAYKHAWNAIHDKSEASDLYLPFPQKIRRYQGKFGHAVSVEDLEKVIAEA